MPFKISALKNVVIFTGKHLYWNLSFVKFQALNLLKRDSNTGVVL